MPDARQSLRCARGLRAFLRWRPWLLREGWARMVQRRGGRLSIQRVAKWIAVRPRPLYFLQTMAVKRFGRLADLGLTMRQFGALKLLDTPQRIQAFLHGL